jgi:hypothetical protein
MELFVTTPSFTSSPASAGEGHVAVGNGEMRGSQALSSRPLTYPNFVGAPSSPALRERTKLTAFEEN